MKTLEKLVKKYGAFNVLAVTSAVYGCLAAAVLTQVCPGFHWLSYDFAGFFNNVVLMTTTFNGLVVTSITMIISFNTGLLVGKLEAR